MFTSEEALIDPALIAQRLMNSESREKRADKVLKFKEAIALEIHGSLISKHRYVDAFYEK